LVLAIYTVYQAWFVREISHPTPWLVFNCLYLAFITVVPLTIDEKTETLPWLCTLPVTRADVVRGRYVTAWAMVAGLYVLSLGLAAIVPGSDISPLWMVQPDTLLLAASLTTFIVALLLPFTIRFGFTGVLLTLIAAQVLGGVMLVVAMATGGRLGGGISAAVGLLREGILAARGSLGVLGFQLALLVVLLLVNWASYRASVWLFRRREF
jgi:ABC-type transport system involved in multi-copper enzyme maturation permease subunit